MLRTRNVYASLLLGMLKRGCIEGPFVDKPQSGPLPTLPAYTVSCCELLILFLLTN